MPANPVRKLMRLPGARWVLSSIVLAAGVGLAVDYLNTPLRPWLQFHAKVPFINGGKSVAEVAAEESGSPQAVIDRDVTQPARAAALRQGIRESQKEYVARAVSLGERQLVASGGETYRPVSHFLGDLLDGGVSLPDWDGLSGMGGGEIPDFVNAAPKPLGAHVVTPFMIHSGKDLAVINEPDDRAGDHYTDAAWLQQHPGRNWAMVKLDDETFGAMLEADYRRLRVLPAQPKPLPASGPPMYAIPSLNPVLKGGRLYIKNASSGAWEPFAGWDNCKPAPVAGGPRQLNFYCDSTGGFLGAGKTYRVVIDRPAGAPDYTAADVG